MRSFDTNVAVRLIILDDPAQCDAAARAFRDAAAAGGAFFATTVLVEVAWVLRVAYRAAIAEALRRLTATVGVVTEHAALVARALSAYEQGTADFSDDVSRESSREAAAIPVVTFDRRFAEGLDVAPLQLT